MAVQPRRVHARNTRAENAPCAERTDGRAPHPRRGGGPQPDGLQERRAGRADVCDPHARDPVQRLLGRCRRRTAGRTGSVRAHSDGTDPPVARATQFVCMYWGSRADERTYVRMGQGQGSLAEYIVAAPPLVLPKPSHLSFEAAGSLALTGLTGWMSLVGHADLQAGQRVFINGGSGGTGLWGIQVRYTVVLRDAGMD
jgi:hypothetical protein